MEIDVETLRKWLEVGRPVTVLDVRPLQQRAEWSIPGSMHADVYDALWSGSRTALDSVRIPAGIPVVTVCAKGETSRKAAELLSGKGIEAYSLQGGMRAWSTAWNIADFPFGKSGDGIVQVRRVGKGCLSYLVHSQGQAAVIDASLEPSIYLRLAEARGLRITAVLDTHLHADHLSRSPALASLAQAELHQPWSKHFREDFSAQVGSLRLTALPTPGHTPDGVCYRVENEEGDEHRAVMTGDTLFLDSVGRPDLLAETKTAEQANLLYQSLRRLSALPGNTLVLPGHHPAPPAFDGVPIAATLDEVKSRNRFLRASEDEFVSALMEGADTPPPNHLLIMEANISGTIPKDLASLEAGPNRCAGG